MESQNKWGVEEVHGVPILNDSNFEDFLKKHKYVFVDFYADWCGPCKMMAPAYAEVTKKMNSIEHGIPVVKIDADINKLTGSSHNITSYPTLRLYQDGKPIAYEGGRSTSEIFNFIRKKTGFASDLINTKAELSELQKEEVCVFYYLPKEDENAFKEYNQIGAEVEDVRFAHTHDGEIAHDIDLAKKYSLIVIKKFDGGNVKEEQDTPFTFEEIKKFVQCYAYPLITPIEEAGAKIFNDQTNSCIFVSDQEDSEEFKNYQNFAQEHKGQLLFSFSSITKKMGPRLAGILGITIKDDPCVFFLKFDDGNMLKYKITDLSQESLKMNLKDYQNNVLEPTLKSEDIPEPNQIPHKVVGKTFEQEVLKNEKWVFLDIYAHWCGPCVAMAPQWKLLAEKLQNYTNEILVAKIDGSLNEHPKLKVNSYPTIRLYKPNSGEFIAYSGARNCEGFLSFLEEHTGKQFQ